MFWGELIAVLAEVEELVHLGVLIGVVNGYSMQQGNIVVVD